MQQALYNNHISINSDLSSISGWTAGAAKAGAGRGLARWITYRWDLVGVLTLMGSSAAYGLFALAHLA